MVGWLAVFIIVTVLDAAAYLIMPKPKQPAPSAVQQGQDPTASAGKTITVIFGEMMVQDPNVLWFGEKSTQTYNIDV